MTELLIKLGLKDKIVGVFDNDNALKGDIADEIASLNSLGDKKSVSKETILATEPDLILGKGPLMFTESSIGTVQSYQELGIPVYTELASASFDQSLDNIVEDVRNIGEIFNVQETAYAYADELQERIDALMDKVSGQSGEPLKVLFMAGYADGTFRPSAQLTGFAFLKMLLTALGYDSAIEGFTGTNWTVNVASRAIEAGLTKGNENFVGTRAATREEACLYAVNALKATLVEYENKGTDVTVNGATVAIGASQPTYVCLLYTSDAADE